MDFFDYVLIFFVPVVLIISGLMMWLKTPNPNSKYGWHTDAFAKDAETFKRANKFGGKAVVLSGIAEAVITLLIILFIGYNSTLSILVIVVQFLGYFVTINRIEKILINKFQK